MFSQLESGVPVGTEGARILVVEDDLIVARDVKATLEDLGYSVADTVRRGEWVREAVRTHHPDLVLMDIRLAGAMDGVEAAQTLEGGHRIPVVYLTAYADARTLSRARESTPFGYLVKPFTDQDLQTAVEMALLRHELEQELVAERSRLAERVKEQSCLYEVSRIFHQSGGSLSDRLLRVAQRLPAGWQYPEITVARITVDEEAHTSEGFEATEWSLRESLVVDGETVGAVEVHYLEERPREDVGPFLGEERQLLSAIAERVEDEIGRVQAESRLRESELRFRQMAEAIHEVFWLRDPESREMLYLSPAFETIWGRDVDEVYDDARVWLQAIHPEDRPRVAELLIGREDPAGEVEYRIVRPDGEVRWIYDRAFPVTDADGSVYRVAGVARDVTDRKEFEAQLQKRALHDYLTGLPNRALFRDRLEHALERSDRTGEHIAVLFVDLKRFKVVNDSLGHDAGDRVLKEVGRRLHAALREQDTVARIGGDEFTVLLEDLESSEGARNVADRLVAGFEAPVRLGERDVPIEASIGIAVHDGRRDPGEASASDLLRSADTAMYRAKQMPGTVHLVAETSGEQAHPERLERETRLRTAIEEETLRTAYQPIYSLETGRITGVEALARWEDPDLGNVPPGVFIPLAEETGLIIALGEQQLRQACIALGSVQGDPGGDRLQLHVNLSAHQLEDPDVVERTSRVLEETGFPAGRLCLEITESAAMQTPEALDRLGRLGLTLAIDDFGTRYSTLAQLRDLRAHALKIDRTFVAGLPDDSRDRALTETILTLGRALELRVVAEGVENEDQLDALRTLGCQQAQGFHLSRPLPLDDLRALLGDGAGPREAD